MIRKIFSLLLTTVLISSCGNKGNKETSSTTQEPGVKVEFAALIENPDNYVDKDMVIEGKVVHVCPHTGKKMFIVGENPDIRLYIQAGDDAEKFPMELLGSIVTVEGRLTKMTAPQKPEGEMMAEKDSAMKMGEGEACETETAVAAQPVLADLVLNYKSHVVKQ